MSKVRRVWHVDPPIAEIIKRVAKNANRSESAVVNAILLEYFDSLGGKNE